MPKRKRTAVAELRYESLGDRLHFPTGASLSRILVGFGGAVGVSLVVANTMIMEEVERRQGASGGEIDGRE